MIKSGSAGFTLLELTIVMTIMTMLVLVLGFALRLGIKSLEKSESKIDSLDRTRTSLRIVESQLQSFIPLQYGEVGKNGVYYFKGQEDGLSFVSSVSLWGRQGGIILVTYEVVRDRGSDTSSLVIKEESAYSGETRSTVLLKNFKEISFNFFTKKPTDKEGDWGKSVDNSDNVPLSISLFAESTNFKIELMVPVRARASTAFKNPTLPNIFDGSK
ncbi:protein GspJ2 [Candidatus Magnetobacterium bavaricum]|uniref:Protein GspJ2 n=1 Tax=Candidatus Magnetobacterium bavaricum TaxID=29290 RepID=A0A0F3GVL2_9BACT|nr:protein GspJ2 [Candidatus Magnetobacterium bavaricum]